MTDLARSDELTDGACDILDRHIGVDAVLVEQVDHLDYARLVHGRPVVTFTSRSSHGRPVRPGRCARGRGVAVGPLFIGHPLQEIAGWHSSTRHIAATVLKRTALALPFLSTATLAGVSPTCSANSPTYMAATVQTITSTQINACSLKIYRLSIHFDRSPRIHQASRSESRARRNPATSLTSSCEVSCSRPG